MLFTRSKSYHISFVRDVKEPSFTFYSMLTYVKEIHLENGKLKLREKNMESFNDFINRVLRVCSWVKYSFKNMSSLVWKHHQEV